MGAFERITVAVPTEMAETLRRSIDHGEYASEGEIVRDALADWARARRSDEAELERLRQAVREADASGPPVPADEAFARVHARIDRMNRQDADQ